MSEEKPVRIGDQEREEAVARLGAHYEAGRLTAEEHQERVGQALQAKTQAELAALFDDLPGESTAGQAAGQDEWLGPWGWARPPWTAPPDKAWAAQAWAAAGDHAGSQKAPGSGRQYGPPWMAGGRGPFGRFPLPVLIALAAIAVVASVACTVLGGHPPILPLLLIVAAVVIVKKRKEQHA